jgi:cytolysin (calcineurin-like family phosphatase)
MSTDTGRIHLHQLLYDGHDVAGSKQQGVAMLLDMGRGEKHIQLVVEALNLVEHAVEVRQVVVA